MSNSIKSSLILLTMLAALVLVLGYVPDLSGAAIMQYELTLDDAIKLMTNLFFIAILMERFMEVFITVIRQEGKIPLEIKRNSAKKLLDNMDHTNPDLQLQSAYRIAKDAYDDHELSLEKYRAETARITVLVSLFFGVVISLAGVHVLQTIFDIEDLIGIQKFLFISVDVVLTAGIISGGSKGINSITKVLGDFFDTRRTILNNAAKKSDE